MLHGHSMCSFLPTLTPGTQNCLRLLDSDSTALVIASNANRLLLHKYGSPLIEIHGGSDSVALRLQP
ncbi:hypothetical protein XENTR_v10021336 [Xenopus tropicalis]|nr:hypothetical protein XENTR_v10021336 [Xenopus tropicalis]